MTAVVYYLAYGSNLHPQRLAARLGEVRLEAVVEIADRRLCFHKRGADDSGKCDLLASPGSLSWGGLYQIERRSLSLLDRFEGGYQRQSVLLQTGHGKLEAFTYQAESELIDPQLLPYDWYLQLVIQGGYHLGFEPDYLQQLESRGVQQDSDPERRALHQQLLQGLQKKAALNHLSTARVLEWLTQD